MLIFKKEFYELLKFRLQSATYCNIWNAADDGNSELNLIEQ